MQTTQKMMSFKAANIKPLGMSMITEYINIYRDEQGKKHWSVEEFDVECDGLHSFDAALQDAYKHTVLGDWDYVETSSTHAPESTTIRIERHLERLEQAVDVIAAYGKDAPREWQEAEELAAQLTESRI